MTIIYNFFILATFITYDFNLDSHNNNHIFIMFIRIFCTFFNTHISCIISYYFQNKRINISYTCGIRSTYRIRAS